MLPKKGKLELDEVVLAHETG
eukprot:COSAG04_NODE_4321_length_2158_cov_1.742593_1_plen_20_part_10